MKRINIITIREYTAGVYYSGSGRLSGVFGVPPYWNGYRNSCILPAGIRRGDPAPAHPFLMSAIRCRSSCYYTGSRAPSQSPQDDEPLTIPATVRAARVWAPSPGGTNNCLLYYGPTNKSGRAFVWRVINSPGVLRPAASSGPSSKDFQ